MDSSQIENAIEVLWSVTSDANLKQQALNYTQQLRNEPTAWQACLPILSRTPPASEQVRHFALEIVARDVEAFELDAQSLEFIRVTTMDYVRRNYSREADGKPDSPHIQNKLAQVLTHLFVVQYESAWQSFFDDFLALAQDGMAPGGNLAGTIMYLRLLGSVHEEVADQLINRSTEKTKKTVVLRDLIRDRDSAKIAAFWQELLSKWSQVDSTVMEMCLRTIARWVGWSDISIIANQPVLDGLLQMAGQQNISSAGSPEGKLRDAAIEAFTAIASKKMRPADKIELIKGLNLETVVGQLIASQALSEHRSTPKYDTDLAESVARLVNSIVRDLVIVLDSEEANEQTKTEASNILQAFVPYLLRFFADEYDEVCSSVIDGLMEILTFLRRLAKDRPGQIPQEYLSILPPVLHAIINKMKFDDTASWGEEGDESDEAEFAELRKRLNTLQGQINHIDEPLVIATISELVQQTFQNLAAGNGTEWRSLELALYQMYLFGEVATKASTKAPKGARPTAASEQLWAMVQTMMASKVGEYQHPAVQIQFIDNIVRYSKFFETNTQWIPSALEIFVSYSHSQNSKVRLQSWYSFQRFTRQLRGHLGAVSQTVIQAIADLLTIKAVLPTDREEDDDDSSSDASDFSDPVFHGQLYLFETVGCLASPASLPVETKLFYIQSITNPIFTDMEQNLSAAKAGDERAIVQIHHNMMALGSVSHGFTDWMPGMKVGDAPPQQVSGELVRCGEAILVTLESLNSSLLIRQAAQNSLARLLGGMGNRVLPQLPRWIQGLLSQSSTKDETTQFLHLLTQIIFAFKADIGSVLDAMLTPLLNRVFEQVSQQASGTDDELQLGELRRKLLSFVTIVLNHDLGSVFVSSNNQTTFENVIQAIEHFSRDGSDLPTARLAIGVITRMVATWGGPDIFTIPSRTNPSADTAPSPTIPGFDAFAISRFSPLSWAIPSTPGFKARDPAARLLIHEVATMQQEILKKTGGAYVVALGNELRSMGLGEADVELYLASVRGENKAFKEFLARFLNRGES